MCNLAGPIPGMSLASSRVRGFFAARCSSVLLGRTMKSLALRICLAISDRFWRRSS